MHAPAGEAQSAADGFAFLAEAILRDDGRRIDSLVATLVGRWTRDLPTVAGTALRAATTVAWERGWQPADLVHAVGRKLSAPDRRLLVAAAIADAGAWRAHPAADPIWLDQVADLEADSSGPTGLEPGSIDVSGAVDFVLRAASLLGQLWRVPSLPPVGDPPSAWGTTPRPSRPAGGGASTPAGIDGRILSRVRALLAKAESTEFAPEAEALTAKAQELMARYAIDQALVSSSTSDPSGGGGDKPRSRRVLIHDPYAKGKSYLLSEVAQVNRCQTVWAKEMGFSTVFGFDTDLAVTDILYTSLVTQCSTAMIAASRTVANPRSFRESFVLSFAIHIGERLAAATAATVEAARAELGDALLPVLASRDVQVEAARDEAFPRLRSNPIRVTDSRGWAAGQAAAELARLDVGKAVGS